MVARLRNDIAYAELQYSLGNLYSSVGMNFVPDDLAQISDSELAVALEDNLNRWTKNYNSFITMPINEQNPIFEQTILKNKIVVLRQTSEQFYGKEFAISYSSSSSFDLEPNDKIFVYENINYRNSFSIH